MKSIPRYDLKKSEREWDNYYKGKGSFKGVIRKINTLYFTKIFERVLNNVTKSRKGIFLEAGSGEGVMSSRLSKRSNSIVILDISKNALREAIKNFKDNEGKAEFVKGDIFNMGFADNSFDVIWNQGVLEHFDCPEKAIKEMFRVTKDGGYVIIFVPAKFSPLNIYYNFLNLLGLKKLFPFGDQIFYSKSLLERQINSACKRSVEVRRILLSFGFSMVGVCQK